MSMEQELPEDPTNLDFIYCYVDDAGKSLLRKAKVEEHDGELTATDDGPPDHVLPPMGTEMTVRIFNDDRKTIDAVLSQSNAGAMLPGTGRAARPIEGRMPGGPQSHSQSPPFEVSGDALEIAAAALIADDPKIQLSEATETLKHLEMQWDGQDWVIMNWHDGPAVVHPGAVYYVAQDCDDPTWLKAYDLTLETSEEESICAVFVKRGEEADPWYHILEAGRMTEGQWYHVDFIMEPREEYCMNLYISLDEITVSAG